MTKSKPTSKQESWNSDRALGVVRDCLIPEWSVSLGDPVDWSPDKGEEIWQALSREVQTRSHRGYQQPGLVLMTSAFKDAKASAQVYGQLRTRLFAFATLLRVWRQELVAEHGSDCWDRALPNIHDPKEKVVVEHLRQVSSRTIEDAVRDLDGQGREGFTYHLAGQNRVTLKPSDCGIALFVEAARLLIRRLSASEVDAKKSEQGHPNHWPRVLVYFRHHEVRLTRNIPANLKTKGGFRECTLDDTKCCALFLALLSVDGIVSRSVLYQEHTHREEHLNGDKFSKKTQNRLSQLKRI